MTKRLSPKRIAEDPMSINDRSRHPSPADGEDTCKGHTEVEIPDRSFMGIKPCVKCNQFKPVYRDRSCRAPRTVCKDCQRAERRERYIPVEERNGATYDEIGAVLGVTRQRVIQIEREALRKLRHAAENLMRVKQVKYDWKPGEDE